MSKQEKVEQRAKELYIKSGELQGYDLANWTIAELQIENEELRALLQQNNITVEPSEKVESGLETGE